MEESKEFEGWISVREASQISGYTTEYVRELARDGLVDSVKIGNVFVINERSLREYVDKKTQLN